MERTTFIYSACGKKNHSAGEQTCEQIFKEVYDELVSLGCETDREVVLKGSQICVYKTVFVDVIEESDDDQPIDLDIDWVYLAGGQRVPQEIAPRGYVYINGELCKVK